MQTVGPYMLLLCNIQESVRCTYCVTPLAFKVLCFSFFRGFVCCLAKKKATSVGTAPDEGKSLGDPSVLL